MNNIKTAYPMGVNIGMLANVLPNASLEATAGAPLQPTLPRQHQSDDVVEHESTGVQCPSAEASKETLVH